MLLLHIILPASAGCYGAPEVLTGLMNYTWERKSVATGDLDADGDLDLVVANFDGVHWFEDLGGGVYGPPQAIVTTPGWTDAHHVAVGDLDSDGDLDVLSTRAQVPTILSWSENLGAGVFAPYVNVATDLSYPELADVDGDGDLDVLTTEGWLPNLGAGALGVLMSGTWGAAEPVPGDADGDGDVDVLFFGTAPSPAIYEVGVAWAENLGGGVYAPAAFLHTYTFNSYNNQYTTWPTLAVRDIDGDGDADTVFDEGAWTDWSGTGPRFRGDIVVIDGDSSGPLPARVRGETTSGPISLGDLEGDGDVDLVSGDASAGLWIESRPRDTVWHQLLRDPTMVGQYEDFLSIPLKPVDLDGDGDLDLLGSTNFPGGWGSSLVRWRARFAGPDTDGDGLPDADEGAFGTDPLVADLDGDGLDDDQEVCEHGTDALSADTDGDGVSDGDEVASGTEPRDTDTDDDGFDDGLDNCPSVSNPTQDGDTDGDGICDVDDNCRLIADPTQADGDGDGTGDVCDVCVGPSDGRSPFDPPVRIGEGIAPTAADLDGDGDPDLLAGDADGRPRWYENLGGSFGPVQTLPGAVAAEAWDAADLDGDGDLDIISDVAGAGDIGWFENLGGGTFAAFATVLTSPYHRGQELGDIDGDGLPDLVFVPNATTLAFRINLGGLAFGSTRTLDVATSFGDHDGRLLVDLDSDGDLDVVSFVQDSGIDLVVWYENLGTTFAGRQVITSHADDPYFQDPLVVTALDAGDLDGDGDTDLLVSSAGSLGVRWIPNLGGGHFGPPRTLGADTPSLIADVEGDGDLDVVASERLGWFANTGSGAFEVRRPIASQYGEDVAMADVDGDGLRDLIGVDGDTLGVAANRWSACVVYDTDGDSLSDTMELLWTGTDVGAADTDFDGLSDLEEQSARTDAFDSDSDGDGLLDGLDECPRYAASDPDGDGICGGDSCPHQANPDQSDLDHDGLGDACDPCFASDAADRFGPARVLWRGPGVDTRGMAAADGDGDGDIDVATLDALAGEVQWSTNAGDGTFTPGTVIPSLSSSSERLGRLEPADLDADGDLDLIVALQSDDPTQHIVAAHVNLGGGAFGPPVGIGPSNAYPWLIRARDLDDDGDLDVLAYYSWAEELWWFENVGNTFATSHLVSTGRAFRDLVVADLDGDGDPDIAAAGEYDPAPWFENLGGGSFGGPVDLWGYPLVYALRAGDPDEDGDVDLLGASGEVVWVEALGAGAFAAPVEIADLTNEVSYHLELVDVDGDGDDDVVHNGRPDDATDVGWIDHLGGGRFGRDHGTPFGVGSVHELLTPDLDGDGDADLLVADPTYEDIAWHENVGGCVPLDSDGDGLSDATEAALGTDPTSADTDGDLLLDGEEAWEGLDPLAADSDLGGTDDATEAASGRDALDARDDWPEVPVSAAGADAVATGDLDGDGDLDLAVATATELAWHANLGGGQLTAATVVDSLVGTSDVAAGDVDGDGDLDLVVTDDLAWYENLGAGTFGAPVAIDAAAATEVELADLDADGDLDIASIEDAADRVSWHENAGGGAFLARVDLATLDGARGLDVADLDADGVLDLLVASSAADEVTWLPGLGAPVAVSTTLPTAAAVRAADVDADGLLDVVIASEVQDAVSVVRQLAAGAWGPHLVLSSTTDGPRSLDVGDVDGDGDLEVVTASAEGVVLLDRRRATAITLTAANDVVLADLDGDSHIDVASASDGAVAWHENVLDAPAPPMVLIPPLVPLGGFEATFEVTHATPNASVVVAFARGGAAPVTGCTPGPDHWAPARADSDGRVTFSGLMPELSGRSMSVQAVEAQTCRTSSVTEVTVW